MRVTQGMIVGNFLNNLNSNYKTLEKIQEQVSSGRSLSRPSDDPVKVVSSLRLRTNVTEMEKYLGNVADAIHWLQSTDTALSQTGDVLQRVRELTIKGANGILPQASRDALAKEVAQLKEQLVQVANSTHEGRYIFGGFKTTTAPFTGAGVYNGDTGIISYEIGINVSIPVNVTGDAVFINTQNIFQLLTDIEADLTTGNVSNLSDIRIGELDNAIDNILSIRADVGAKTNRLELTKTHLEDANLNLSGLLSKNDDIDLAEVITQLQMQENVYRTALAAGARIMQPSLIDFLR